MVEDRKRGEDVWKGDVRFRRVKDAVERWWRHE